MLTIAVPMFSQAASFINHTNRNLFLTGKAGTGKTTFLHYIKENCMKKLAVVAPTGVAAINAGGTTIHAFFLLPWGTFLPTNTLLTDVSDREGRVFTRPQLKAKLKLNRRRLTTIRELELLIIDEVSMVRADLLDAIDFILKTVRQNYSRPFGGVQMLFIGDMMQLPPVLKNEEESLLRNYYRSPYFFDAQVIREANPIHIELKKIYRQSSEDFIALLNKIRSNSLSEADLKYLNSFYRPEFTPRPEEEYITLTSHNYLADRINETELDNLNEELYTFDSEISGDFPERMYPTEKTLRLKKGAQIMFIKNDKGENRRYYNGKIGIIDSFSGEEINIRFKSDTELLPLKRERWQNVKYIYNAESDAIDEEELGSFSQYPIRLAWAITIHKSQGLTFERAVIDAGASFASGQVYVALSRLSSLDGLILHSRIFPSSISVDAKLIDFSEQEHNEEILPEILEKEQLAYIHERVLKTFDWNKGFLLLSEYFDNRKATLFDEEEELFKELDTCVKKLAGQKETAEKFVSQLRHILPANAGESCNYKLLYERVNSASTWFSDALSKDILTPLKQIADRLKSMRRNKRKQKEVLELLLFFERKRQQLANASEISRRLTQPFRITDLLGVMEAAPQTAAEAETTKPVATLPKGETKRISLRMFREGKTAKEIARERKLTLSTVEGHLISFIPTGETFVEDFVTPEKREIILDFFRRNPESKNSSDAKKELGDNFSYIEIKAAMIWQRNLPLSSTDSDS